MEVAEVARYVSIFAEYCESTSLWKVIRPRRRTPRGKVFISGVRQYQRGVTVVRRQELLSKRFLARPFLKAAGNGTIRQNLLTAHTHITLIGLAHIKPKATEIKRQLPVMFDRKQVSAVSYQRVENDVIMHHELAQLGVFRQPR